MNIRSGVEQSPRRGFVAAVSGACVATVVAQALPLLVLALTTSLKLDPVQIGWLAATDLGIAAVSNGIFSLVSHRADWRTVSLWALLLLAAANIATALSSTLPALLACRVVAGIAEGVIGGVAYSALATGRMPERQFAITSVCQTALGAAALALTPVILARSGWRGEFVALAIVCVPALAMTSWLPRGALTQATSSATAPRLITPAVTAGLAGILATFLGIGVVWAYLGLYGESRGVPLPKISAALADAAIVSVVAALCAAALGNWLNRLVGITISVFSMTAGLALLASFPTAVGFFAGAVALMCGIAFYLPFAFGVMSAVDRSGAATSMANALSSGGVALGPLLASPFVERGGSGVTVDLAILLIVGGFGAIAPIAWRSRRRS
ncbi:MAG: MFS transporter [Proteobacteria bacterium]|nr:MFS transporter [Pseudomonadota bacterium]